MAWAPGKGTKGKEFKEFWEVDVGSSYIPWDRLPPNIDLDPLEEGGMIDEESLPNHLVELRKQRIIEKIEKEKADQLLKEQTIAAEKLRAEAEAQAAAILSQNSVSAPVVPPALPTMNIVQPPLMIPNAASQPPALNLTSGINIPGVMAGPPPGPPPGAIPLEQFKNMVSYPTLKAINQFQSSSKSGPLAQSPLLPQPGHLGGSGPPPLPLYSTPPMAVPPPQVLSGHPPPPLPWGSRPPPSGPPQASLTGSNAQPLGFANRNPMMGPPPPLIVPPLAPHLRPAVPPPNSSLTLPARIHPVDMPLVLHDPSDRGASSDDPFAPSLYELKNMNRGRPGPYPMENTRPPLLGRFEDNNFRNRNRFSGDGMSGPRNSWNEDTRDDWRNNQNRDHFTGERRNNPISFSNRQRNTDNGLSEFVIETDNHDDQSIEKEPIDQSPPSSPEAVVKTETTA